MKRGQVELLPDFIHLVAHDVHDLVERALPEEQIRINSSSQLPDITSADEEFVARDLGISRSLAQRGNEQFRPAMHADLSEVETCIVNESERRLSQAGGVRQAAA